MGRPKPADTLASGVDDVGLGQPSPDHKFGERSDSPSARTSRVPNRRPIFRKLATHRRLPRKPPLFLVSAPSHFLCKPLLQSTSTLHPSRHICFFLPRHSQPPNATADENEFRSSSYLARPASPAVFGAQASRQSLDVGTTAKGDLTQRSTSHRSILSESPSRKWTRASSGNTFGNAISDKIGEDEPGTVRHEDDRERRFSELAGTGLATWEDSSRISHRGSLQGGIGI